MSETLDAPVARNTSCGDAGNPETRGACEPSSQSCRFVSGAKGPPPGSYDADVVILALERPEETLAAIASALRQRGVSRHVFVVDQGSSPGTLRRLAAAVSGRPDATLVSLSGNQGVAGGRNHGSALGHGRVIAALDNDAEYATDDTLARMVRALDAEPGLGAIGCRITSYATGRDDLSSWGYPKTLLPSSAHAFDTVTFVGAGHAIRRTAWEDAGGYDGALFFCWEEYDFCLRAIALGWQVRYRGDIVVRHKVSPDRRIAWSGGRWFYHVRNRLYIARKQGAGWLALASRIAGYVVKGLRNGRPLQTVQAVRAGMALPVKIGADRLPREARAYLRRNDRLHRGSVARRVWREVLAGMPGHAVASPLAADHGAHPSPSGFPLGQ